MQRLTLRRALALVLASILAALTASSSPFAAPAKKAKPDPSAPVRETVSVGLIDIPLYVEDSKGQLITDLKLNEISIFEDGKKMKISNFSWVDPPLAAAAAKESESPNLHVILYVDSQNIRPANQQAVLKRLGEIVENEIPEDVPVMLAASRPHVEVLKAFSAPRSLLPYRLEELAKSTAGGLFDANASRLQRDEIGRRVGEIQNCARTLGCDLNSLQSIATSAIGEIRAYGNGVAGQVRTSMDRFQSFARSLNSFPGTKAVLYVSDGMPVQAGQDLFNNLDAAIRRIVNETSSRTQETRAEDEASYRRLLEVVERSSMDSFSNDVSKIIEQATAVANANGVRVYTLQASALSGTDASDSDNQTSLRMLANSTGGTFLQGAVRSESMLRRMIADTQGYYSVAYTPPPSAEQAYHEIEIKLKRRRARARHPHGYITRSDQSRRIEQVLAALFHGYGDNASGIALNMERGGLDPNQQPLIQMQVLIPVKSMDLLPRGDQHATDLKLIVAVMNGSGRTTMLREFPVAVQIPSNRLDQVQEQSYPVRLQVPGSRGSNRIAVGLWDTAGRQPALTHGSFDLDGE